METIKLVDGERGADKQCIYFNRAKLPAGEYLLFYRCAFKDPPYGGSGIGGTGDHLEAIKKVDPNAPQMDGSFNSKQKRSNNKKDKIEMDYHTERKIVVSINYPQTARIEL